MNIPSLPCKSYELAPGHVLRRASSEEVAEIKVNLKMLFAGPKVAIPYYLWEAPWPPERGIVPTLPEANWRYFVIEFEGGNAVMNEIENATDISHFELEIGFLVFSHALGILPGGGVMWHSARLFQVLEHARLNNSFFKSVSETDLQEINAICTQLRQKTNLQPNIERLIRQMSELKSIPHNSPLRFLGYCGILESLLTHPPKPTDPYDSITRQIKKKIALLNNRWNNKLDYEPFHGAPPEKLWNSMYEYRSCLAHGGIAEFKGRLAMLIDHEKALKLVKDTVKAVIRQALAEPRLLEDLRNC